MWSALFFRSGREGVSEDVAAHIQHEIFCQCIDTDQSRLTPALSAQQLLVPTAPRLTLSELDFVHDQEKKGKTPIEIHAMLMRKHDRQGITKPCWKETRGRKAKLNHRLVLRMNATRTLLIKQAKGQREVR